MAQSNWTNTGAADWSDGTNWSTGAEPMQGDDVTVGQGEADITTAVPAVDSVSIGAQGTVSLQGQTAPARLEIASVAGFGTSGTLDGTLVLAGDAVVSFDGDGQLTTIDQGASLVLNGAQAFVADSTDLASNSALTGLAANAGTLTVTSGALVTVTGNFDNTGALNLYGGYQSSATGLVVGGTLSNAGDIEVDDDFNAPRVHTLEAASLDNGANSFLNVYDFNTGVPDVLITGASVNDGQIGAEGASVVLSGAVTGSGLIAIGSDGRLELGAGTTNTLDFQGDGTDTVVLDDPAAATGPLLELAAGDTIDLVGFAASDAVIDPSRSTLTVDQANGPALTFSLEQIQDNTTFTTQSDDNGGTDLMLMAGQPPSITAPASETLVEGTSTTLSGISVADTDPNAGTITVIVASENEGGITASTAGAGSVFVDNAQTVELTGSLSDVNAELATIVYTAPLRTTDAASSPDTIAVTMSDSDNGGASASIPVTVDVGPVVVTAPASAETAQDVPALIAGLSLADSATSTGSFTVTVASVGGTVAIGDTTDAVVGDNDSGQVTLTGSLDAIDAALGTVSFDAAEPAGDQGTASISVQATDPLGNQDQQLVAVTVDVAPYDHFQDANVQFVNDLADDNAGAAQLQQDAFAVEAQAISGAIGTFAGISAQIAFDNTAGVLPNLVQAAPGTDGADAEAYAVYDTLLQGAVGTLGTGGAVPSSYALFSILNQVTDDGVSQNGSIDLDDGLLKLDIQTYYQDLSGTSSVDPSYQDAYQASLQDAETFVSDATAIAGPAQLLADATTLYDGMITAGLSPVGSADTLTAVQASLGALAVDLAASAGEQPILNDMTGIYTALLTAAPAPQVVTVDATASNTAALQTLDTDVTGAEGFGTVAGSGNVQAILTEDVGLYGTALTSVASPGASLPNTNVVLGTYNTIVQQYQTGAGTSAMLSTANGLATSILGSPGSAAWQAFATLAAAVPAPPSGSDDVADLNYALQLFNAMVEAAASVSTSANNTITQALTSLNTDLSSGSGSGSQDLESFVTALLAGGGSAGSDTVAPGGASPLVSAQGFNADFSLPSTTKEQALDALEGQIFGDPTSAATTVGGVVASAFVAGAAGGTIAAGLSAFALLGFAIVTYKVVDYLIDNDVNVPPANKAKWDQFKQDPAGYFFGDPPAGHGGKHHGHAHGDVHLETFTGQDYDFQAQGEFTLAKSTEPGNSFDIQVRLEPLSAGASVTYTTAVAAEVGSDRVTFDLLHPDLVWVDGAPSTLSTSNAILNLAGGQVVEFSPTLYQITWNTGEVLTVDTSQGFIDTTVALGANDGPGSVEGLLGTNTSQATDFTLADGTVLSEPLTTSELYGEFADSWRVTDQTTLLDYGTNPDGSQQTTASFTDVNFPADVVTLAQLPPDLVAQAAALAAAAGITDPTLAQDAELDYLATGNLDVFTSAANTQQPGAFVTPVTITSTASAPAVSVTASETTVTLGAGQTAQIPFLIYLTAALTTDTTVDYNVVSTNPGDLTAADFAGTLPSGQVVIAAGQTSATVSITLPADVLGQRPTAGLDIAISAPAGQPIFAPTASTTLVNAVPEPGTAPVPVLSQLSTFGTLSQSGTTYTLALGDVVQGESLPLQFAVSNAAAAPADSLQLSLGRQGTGFALTNFNNPPAITAGQGYNGLYVVGSTAALGAQAATVTLNDFDVNASGYSAPLPSLSLQLSDTVLAPAAEQVDTSPIDFGDVHAGSSVAQPVSIGNAGAQGAAALDVTPVTAAGGVTVAGSVVGLAAGSTDATDVQVGIATTIAGAVSGLVTLQAQSDAGGGNTLSLPDQTIALSGTVYREAAAQVADVDTVVHVGDPGTIALSVANTDPADGFSETLDASVTSATGGITSPGGTVSVAAGATPATLSVSVPTTQAGIVDGTVTLGLQSDGSGVDSLGVTTLASDNVAVRVAVDNYAVADITEVSGGGTLSGTGDNQTLDLGTITTNSAPVTIELAADNAASGTADLLSGSFDVAGDSVFMASGFGIFQGLAAGQSSADGTVTLSTATPGSFSETLTLHSTGSNASGYSQALPTHTLTITGLVENPCFCSGTRIRTVRGDLAVEDLCVGDIVLTHFAGAAPVTWLGHRRVNCGRHPEPRKVWPIRVARGAFGGGLPRCELWLSPDHAVFEAGLLVPIRALVNGLSIVQEEVDAVTYWHVELGEHDVLFAEGLPCESYLDVGNRGAFANGGTVVQHCPDFAVRAWEANACAERVEDGYLLELIYQRLASLAGANGPAGASSVLLLG